MHIPYVPFAAFRNLVGDVLAAELEELRGKAAGGELVLFSDATGAQLALITVGEGRRFATVAELAETEIDGLRALCALRAAVVAGGDEPAVAGGAAENGGAAAAHHEESLQAREAYIAECEQKLADAGQRLAEREAMVEQREQALLAKERDFFRRGGEVARQD